MKKAILSKWASRVHESSIFEGRDPQNPSKKRPKKALKKQAFLRRKKDGKLMKKESQNDPKIAPKNV